MACAATEADITLAEPDFSVAFDLTDSTWTTTWKWRDGPYEAELSRWVEKGWLVPYREEEYGPAKGLILLMAVIQRSKENVRPVMDFRELNAHVEAYTASADSGPTGGVDQPVTAADIWHRVCGPTNPVDQLPVAADSQRGACGPTDGCRIHLAWCEHMHAGWNCAPSGTSSRYHVRARCGSP
uniref:Uncharacterized protein n=1 Tax=Trichuris muris TaxID=70415 RepID=A0A5S6Q2J5_TRIMR